jgi:hypothetical protein
LAGWRSFAPIDLLLIGRMLEGEYNAGSERRSHKGDA